MTHYSTIIRNGTLIDGTGAAARRADVAILDGRIAALGNLASATADEEIDATGKIVAPGHVTQHAHYDAALFWDPYCSNSGENGVTTIMNANCGFSIAPVKPADRERTMLMLSTTEQIPVEQQKLALPWDWVSFPEFLDRLRTLPKGVNILTYVPLNPLLIYVMGIDAAKSRRPTAAELREIRDLVNEAMDAGAAGISMSVMGMEGNSHVDFDGSAMPTDGLHDDDVVEIARAVADRGEGIIQMLSQIAYNGNRPLTEKVARMAKGSGARVVHNIFVTVDGLPELTDQDIAWLDALRAEGCDVVAGALITCGWVEAGIRDLDTAAGQMAAVREIFACRSDDEIEALISSPDFVRRFSDEYLRDGPSSGAGGFEHQIVIEVGDHPELEIYLGRTLGDIASETGQTVVEVLCELGLRSSLDMQIKSQPFSAKDGNYAMKLLRHPAIGAGVSDGGAHTKAFSTGDYGTELILRLVRDQKLTTLEDIHYQLSLKVARLLQLQDRGALLTGFWADILVYDYAALYRETDRLEIIHDMPGNDWRRVTKAGGIERVLVNGVTTHNNGKSNGAVPGRFLTITRSGASELLAAE